MQAAVKADPSVLAYGVARNDNDLYKVANHTYRAQHQRLWRPAANSVSTVQYVNPFGFVRQMKVNVLEPLRHLPVK